MAVNTKIEPEVAELVTAHEEGKVVEGIIRGLTTLKMPIDEEGNLIKDSKNTETEVFTVILSGNVIGYCHVNNLRYVKLQRRDYGRHVGRKEPFIIQGIDPVTKVAIVSCVAALRKQADDLWARLSTWTEEEIKNHVFTADVIHYNFEKDLIYAFIDGHVCYMYPNEWSWSGRDSLDVQPGEQIKVKILRINFENRSIRISRKAALPDPFDYLSQLKIGDMTAGKVTTITPNGVVFVKFDNSAEIRGIVPRAIDAPDVGDIVSVRITRVDTERRRGTGVITGYPIGKRKKRVMDLGAFLYDE